MSLNRQDIFNALFQAMHEKLSELEFYEIEHRDGIISLAFDSKCLDILLAATYASPLFRDHSIHFVPRSLLESAYVKVSPKSEKYEDQSIFRKRWNDCSKSNKKIIKAHKQNDEVQLIRQNVNAMKRAIVDNPRKEQIYISIDFESNI
jgi:hypothetical protein